MIPHLNKNKSCRFKPSDKLAPIDEVFFSYQGEGIYAGIPQIFVRFSGCNLRCNYCDTPKSLKINSETEYFETQTLFEYIKEVFEKNKNNFYKKTPSVSFTGGEPLVYADFILELIKKYLKKKFSIYIETNGSMPTQMKKLYRYCDVVSMDIKFPSACGKNLFKEHKIFIENCKNKVFIKMVITKDTTEEEFDKAIKVISAVSKNIPLVIQPSSFDVTVNKKVLKFYSMATSKIKDVRILPQLHKLWEIR
ncbi:MAG: 7-carboxy-7-deazaguanine synthase QueE [Elusimicrobia bacterium]|nr:7-carboxy-7-deazaguanine synthase QueE [Elusimicrobiota bacterium]